MKRTGVRATLPGIGSFLMWEAVSMIVWLYSQELRETDMHYS